MAFADVWQNIPDTAANKWDSRAKRAAELLTGQRGVVDMGCGTMNLRKHLSPEQVYVPVDGVSRGEGSIVCDFNAKPPPLVDVPAMACLGLFEYLTDPRSMLSIAAAHYDFAVVSYCTTDAPKPMARNALWVNAYSRRQLSALFKASGWRVLSCELFGANQHLWKLKAARLDAGWLTRLLNRHQYPKAAMAKAERPPDTLVKDTPTESPDTA
jgi:hypothetical protein